MKWVPERIKREQLKIVSLGYSVQDVFLKKNSERPVSKKMFLGLGFYWLNVVGNELMKGRC